MLQIKRIEQRIIQTKQCQCQVLTCVICFLFYFYMSVSFSGFVSFLVFYIIIYIITVKLFLTELYCWQSPVRFFDGGVDGKLNSDADQRSER